MAGLDGGRGGARAGRGMLTARAEAGGAEGGAPRGRVGRGMATVVAVRPGWNRRGVFPLRQ